MSGQFLAPDVVSIRHMQRWAKRALRPERFEDAMTNPWALKMEQFTAFTESERARLDAIIMAKQRNFQAQEDVIADGAHSEYCHVLLTGLACRYKILPDGERQIMAFLVPETFAMPK